MPSHLWPAFVWATCLFAGATAQGREVTTAEDAAGGCDGIKNGAWGFHTASGEVDPWWQVDLGQACRLDRVVVFNRNDCRPERTKNIQLLVAGSDGDLACQEFKLVYQHQGPAFYGVKEGQPLVINLRDKNVVARIVRLQIPGRCSFALDEVEVFGADDPTRNRALKKPADQKSVGPYSSAGPKTAAHLAARYPSILGHQGAVAGTAKAAADSTPATLFAASPTARQAIDRALKLARRLQQQGGAKSSLPDAAALAELKQLDERLAALEKTGPVPQDAEHEILAAARPLARRIAFCNPLLTNIDKLLFIKRHDPGGVYHMCDQFYGCNAKPGGGLYVLEKPFSSAARLVNLLEHAVVENGRLQGQKLTGGFLAPEVSFDGQTIYFAHSECQRPGPYAWAPDCCYHIFKVQADGTGLTQLTDGAVDDFDPCELPGGRIAFTSLRRGGYLRCGRHCPVYTLFSMEPDGSDIVCLSFHETHEWQPSVNNEGLIVYTRWDYVDRDTNIAHHLWTCFPDGRDPRSFHGNYPLRRESRPWMEMDIRAIPGSHRYVATAGGHHGHAIGSLLLIDPRIEDDNAMSQIEPLTPEVPFPESYKGKGGISACQQYATAWPLSEDDYLCVYDPQAANHAVYWIDRDGNRELIYRDPQIACHNPIPLQARARPQVLPEETTQTARAKAAAGGDRPATIALMNVYDSDFPWPPGTAIKALRVVQVLPKSTAPPNVPRIGVADQTNARAVLGTVPVEADGSAYFEAPVGKELYFQALDAQGLAVQSMRSGTYVHPGERLTCQGCHERKHQSPNASPAQPLALRRGPSKIQPAVSGSNPFNYVRLVQPVLDRHCVACHQEKKALDLTGTVEKVFTRSYNNLASKYGFYYHVSNGSINAGVHGGSRTIAGQFGARASGLLKYLDEKHYGVQLPEEDRQRLVLWLDSNSEFLGSYENAEAQARGELVTPTLE